MDTQKRETWMRKTAAASILPFAALGLAGCGSDTAGTEEGADVEEVQDEAAAAVDEEPVDDESASGEPMEDDAEALVYDGVYDTAFYDDYNSYVGEKVTVSAEVDNIISNMAFTIAGTEDTTVEPLLIMHKGEVKELQAGLAVAVTGTVKEGFDLPTVEEEMGVDLDDSVFEDWDGENYIKASSIDTSVDADASEEEDSEE